MASIRIKRVSDLIHRTIAAVIREDFKDPRVGMVTVSYVDISPDLKQAKIFVTVFEEDKSNQTIDVLNRASGFFRKQLAQTLSLRFTPNLQFYFDEQIHRANRILSLLDTCHRGS